MTARTIGQSWGPVLLSGATQDCECPAALGCRGGACRQKGADPSVLVCAYCREGVCASRALALAMLVVLALRVHMHVVDTVRAPVCHPAHVPGGTQLCLHAHDAGVPGLVPGHMLIIAMRARGGRTAPLFTLSTWVVVHRNAHHQRRCPILSSCVTCARARVHKGCATVHQEGVVQGRQDHHAPQAPGRKMQMRDNGLPLLQTRGKCEQLPLAMRVRSEGRPASCSAWPACISLTCGSGHVRRRLLVCLRVVG